MFQKILLYEIKTASIFCIGFLRTSTFHSNIQTEHLEVHSVIVSIFQTNDTLLDPKGSLLATVNPSTTVDWEIFIAKKIFIDHLQRRKLNR